MMSTAQLETNVMEGKKPKPMDLSHHLTSWAKNRAPSKVKEFYKYFGDPRMINMAGGLPYNQYFPFDTLESSVAKSTRFNEDLNSQFLSLLRSSKDTEHLGIPKYDSPKVEPVKRLDVATALQYGTSEGFGPLRTFVKDFALNYQHQGLIPYEGADILLTCGNTDGFYKAVQLVADPSRDDKMLVEKYCYMNAPQTVRPYGIECVPVEVDDQGMAAAGRGGLKDILENWDVARRGRRPSFMYTIPIGQNPTSGNLTIPRRKEIYELCHKYDIIIVEDDPYWYLQFNTDKKGLSSKDFLPSLIPSYLTVDPDGRVIRLDTFSKTIAPGTRLGWITTNPLFIERLARATETSTAQPSGFVQALVSSLLLQWGMDGWITWLSLLRDKYKLRAEVMYEELQNGRVMDLVQEANAESDARRMRYIRSSHIPRTVAKKALSRSSDDLSNNYSLVTTKKQELYSLVKPQGGMFCWLLIAIKEHPRYDGMNGPDLMVELWKFLAGAENFILVAPGTMFSPTESIAVTEGYQYFRLAFTAVDFDELKKACHKFGPAIQDFWLKEPEDETL